MVNAMLHEFDPGPVAKSSQEAGSRTLVLSFLLSTLNEPVSIMTTLLVGDKFRVIEGLSRRLWRGGANKRRKYFSPQIDHFVESRFPFSPPGAAATFLSQPLHPQLG